FTVLKLAGAAYLGFLGIRALISLRKNKTANFEIPNNPTSIVGRVNSPFLQGLLNNILNPKIAIFFTSLLPQFITTGTGAALGSLTLAGLFALIGMGWLLLFSTMMSTAGSFLRLPRIKRTFDALTGAALLALGIKVATDNR